MTLNSDFWEFVDTHIADSPDTLRLKFHGKGRELEIVQIECRRRYAKKLAQTLERDPHFLFPSVIAGEQSTSDRLAAYHATLVAPGQKIADLTSGLGIDALHLAQETSQITAVEIEETKAEALKYNALNIGATNLSVVCDNCQAYLASLPGDRLDTIYIDPARRSDSGSRVFALSDCQPDLLQVLVPASRVAKRMIAKISPMLDITQTLRELPATTHIIALGSATECKELVIDIDLRASQCAPTISAVTLLPDGNKCELDFTPEQESAAAAATTAAMPQAGGWLCEPYPAVMKAAPFGLLALRYGCNSLHANTHLYYSKEQPVGFPGDIMRIEAVIPYESKHIKRLSKTYPTIRVATRNFDMGADALRKKLGVRDGGDKRLFGATLANGSKAMIIAQG